MQKFDRGYSRKGSYTIMTNMRGFTLVEIIIAIAIISLVSVGAMTAISLSLNSAVRISNDLIAANLAQEGLEVMRGIRDRDWHLGNSFGASFPNNGSYLVEARDQSLNPFAETFLKKDSNGFYNYTSGQDTIFKRKIIIESSGQNPTTVERVIKVEVYWQEKSGPKTIQAELRLFSWR